jgi:hypothetical protein
MSRYLRSAPTGEQPANGGGGAPAQPAQPAGQQGQSNGQQGQPAQPANGQQPNGQPAGDQLGEAGLKALHAERDARKEAERKLGEMEKQLRELTDQRPADEKLAAQLAEIQKRLEQSEIARMRSDTALTHKITPEYAPLLTATTAEELAAQGALIAQLQAAATAAGNTSTTPGHQPHPGQGTPSSGEPPAKTLTDGQKAYEAFKNKNRPPQPATS